jgi:hypothetical protein
VNPDIVVDSAYLGPYFHQSTGGYLDYDAGKATAVEMYRSGVDVIHHSAGLAGQGIPAAAAELTDELGRDLWVIGSEVDEAKTVPPEQQRYYLTSMWKRWDSAVYEAVRAYLAGELETGVYDLGIASGSVDFARDGGLSDANVAAVEEIRSGIVAGTVDPFVEEIASPRWTRPLDVTALIVFDGATCSSDMGPTQMASGDVVRVELVNSATVPAGIRMIPDPAAWDGDSFSTVRPTETILTAPGQRNSIAMRLQPATYAVECYTERDSFEATTFTGVFGTTCVGPEVPNDPAAVVEALAAATNARDADAVCSLFAEDAEDGDVIGNAAIAEEWTPFDDDTFFQEFVITDLDIVNGVVIWDSEYRGLDRVFAVVGHRTFVENGKIVRWERGSDVEG